MPGIGIITNPHSKQNKSDPTRSEVLAYILGEHGIIRSTKCLNHLKETAKEFFKKDIEILAINGGDGTISRTIDIFIKTYGSKKLPKVAILGGGTVNFLKSNLKITNSSENLLNKLTQMYSSNEALDVENIRTLKVEKNFGFLYADGLCARFLEKFYSNKNSSTGSIWLLTKLFFQNLFFKEKNSSFF